MASTRIVEITSSSDKSFEDAISAGIQRASLTLDNIQGACVRDQEVVVDAGRVVEYKVRLEVTVATN